MPGNSVQGATGCLYNRVLGRDHAFFKGGDAGEMSGCEGDEHERNATPPRTLESVRRKMRRKEEGGAEAEVKAPPESPAEKGGWGIVYERTVPRTEVAPPRYEPPSGRVVSLAEAVAGREAPAPIGPPYYLVEKPLEAVHAKLAAYCTDDALCTPVAHDPDERTPAVIRYLYDVCGARMPSLGEMCLVDIETTGLSSSPLFLIGILVCDGERATVRQLLARNYAEERSVIAAYADAAAAKRVLVSFNGKSFDVPYLRARAAATGVGLPELDAHLDLLHAARKVYRGILPDCRLQTLERYVCLRRRRDDIPGAHIPEAYHHFVRTGNAAEVGTILRHNAWDLATLLELMLRMLRGGDPTAPGVGGDA